MTLQHFLDATANVPETALRQAMVAALAIEPARTPEARGRFYDRVTRGLHLDVPDDTSPPRPRDPADPVRGVYA